MATGDRNGARTHIERMPRGVANTKAKLREADVAEIRAQRSSGDSLKNIAARFGVTLQNVHYIVTRATWKHVP